MMRLTFVFLAVAFGVCTPVQSLHPRASGTPPPSPTVCGDIVNSGENQFPAKQAFDCLISVPFIPAVATRFLQYYNESIQFQSTLAYLKDPPSSYQQPPTDLLSGLNQLQLDIENGKFQNQYAFEIALQTLIYSAHDAHLWLFAGILSVFTFASPYSIVSVSLDGVQLPKVYIADDILRAQDSGVGWQPSAVASINGVDVLSYLSQFAASNAIGGLEPHADWNQLMSSSALYVQKYLSIFEGGVTFYPGEDITFTLENGTQLGPDPWIAVYNSQGDTGPLATGGDFYNFFVLGLLPASYDDTTSESGTGSSPTTATSSSQAITSSTATPSPSSWADIDPTSAYPKDTIVAQADLGDSGFITGYFLPDGLTAVLSIPTFYAADAYTLGNFSQTISDFLHESTQAGMTKVVIDIQENSGGASFLAIDTFKQFFPSVEPFTGSRLRAHPRADVLGNTFTQYFNNPAINESAYYVLAASDWVATDRLNADTGQNFTSWGEFFGPRLYNGDYFTTTQRYDLSSYIFDVEASGGLELYGYNDRAAAPAPPYAADDIVILTDGLCSSACALFMEMMHHEAGVRTVVAGGRPTYGPMQAPSGSRGAEEYSFGYPSGFPGDLDADIEVAIQLNSSTSEPLATQEENFWVTFASLNLRDQIREGGNVPLQFVYEAATCRIFYTPQTIFNYTNLWTYAADATWNKPELCVQGSTGYALDGSVTDTNGPPQSVQGPMSNVTYDLEGIMRLSGETYDFPAAFSGQQLSFVGPAPNTRSAVRHTQPEQPPCIGGSGPSRCGYIAPRAGRLPPPTFLNAPKPSPRAPS
ncbi:hypothetical protein GJ744_009200 [Endocarpon pusillum]|uniref:Tail specific protease domain-containing protein n=1 Tax=Endocarpon pusillum TaxID=364733 RepID=A0A8H7AIE9_9EURO|nr:hypothetical protein GJ744_009200 [Endocarpon pusillum]